MKALQYKVYYKYGKRYWKTRGVEIIQQALAQMPGDTEDTTMCHITSPLPENLASKIKLYTTVRTQNRANRTKEIAERVLKEKYYVTTTNWWFCFLQEQ